MLRGLTGWHLVVIVLLVFVLFGWKRLPDMTRSIGRSMRVFKSEVDEMKKDGEASAASKETVAGETVTESGAVPPTTSEPTSTDKHS